MREIVERDQLAIISYARNCEEWLRRGEYHRSRGNTHSARVCKDIAGDNASRAMVVARRGAGYVALNGGL